MEAGDNIMSIWILLYLNPYNIINLQTFTQANPVLICPSYIVITLCKCFFASLIKDKLICSGGFYNCIVDCSFNVSKSPPVTLCY